MKVRRKDCKYCGKELSEGRTNKQFCCDAHRIYWHREQKGKAKKPVFKPTTPESFDGKKWAKNNHSDEPKQWVEPKTEVTEDSLDKATNIALQMDAVKKERPPEHRSKGIGLKSWTIEQKKKIADLQKQLDELI
jgi:hypothetical protein